MDNERLLEKGITQITVRGFKSLYDDSRMEIRPLTILAGANSSGKSSIMQPLLLLKQTLEATYDPGPLLLNGPNVRFTFVDQFLSRGAANSRMDTFTVGIEVDAFAAVTNTFKKHPEQAIELTEMFVEQGGDCFTLQPVIDKDEVEEAYNVILSNRMAYSGGLDSGADWRWEVKRERCFFRLSTFKRQQNGSYSSFPSFEGFPGASFESYIRELIHVPGLRDTQERAYPTSSVDLLFPGVFNSYFATVVYRWQQTQDDRLKALELALKRLELTERLVARRINDAQIELLVGRLPNGIDAQDLVSVADVGISISQVLPVLVALLVAEPGRLVYVEQPETHLHPRAQTALAEIIADAARRGVRVVLETHSSLLLLGIQTLVAEGKLAPELVKLHWFARDPESGVTKITSADLDRAGTFGDWPEDFAQVDLAAQSRYLDAAELEQIAH